MRLALVFLLGCTTATTPVAPSAPRPLPEATTIAIDTTPKERKRMIPPEVFLRAYMTWFGGLAPLDVQQRAKGKQLFDAWDDYLAALGLPDYRIDLPRQSQSNTLMLATIGRLGEALCLRAAEHDLHQKAQPAAIYRFEPKPRASAQDFAPRLDVLHRTFLGYPLALAPTDRAAKLYTLYVQVAARHPNAKNPLSADELAWAAVCSALVQHPETELY